MMILVVCISTTVFITQGNHIGYMFRLWNSHLQAYSLQVKSQDAVYTLGSQCVYISEIFNGNGTCFLTGKLNTLFLKNFKCILTT